MSGIQIRFLLDEHIAHVIRDGLQHRQPEIEVRVVGGKNAPPNGTKDDAILDFLSAKGSFWSRKTDVQCRAIWLPTCKRAVMFPVYCSCVAAMITERLS